MALWDPEQSTQQSCSWTPDPQKPEGDKYILFWNTMFVLICYIAVDN